ncbi:MAG: hypothetical protein HY319_00380 [Armatimonadetes bacterium]|nr:hypothetical protein [Armatimonadota bacterium]
MGTKTIGFAVSDEDIPRLDRLAKKFAQGNRSAFLRQALRQMEVIERAERLAALQGYGSERSAAMDLGPEDAVEVVRRVLKRRE